MPGRHRTPRPRRHPLRVVALLAAVLVILPLGAFGVYQLAQLTSCQGEAALNVAAASEIAPVIERVAADLQEQGVQAGGACLSVKVTAADPADIAAALAKERNATLAGVGLPKGDTQIPDVWVPDSSTWLARLSETSAELAGIDAPSIARSPVVVAMPEPVAARLGWPNAKITWEALLQQVTSDAKLHVGTVEPTRDAAGLSGLLALGAAAAASPGGQTAATAALRSLATGRSTLRQDLLARFPRSADAASIASGLSAAALPEHAVISYNEAKPPIRLAALYVDPAPFALDYPFVLLPRADTTTSAAATALRNALQGKEFHDLLAADGLRAPDGIPGAAFAAPSGAPTPVVTPPPTPSQREAVAQAVKKALSTWIAVTLPAQMLAIIDVSGSMLELVSTAGNVTRAQVTLEAARRGLALLDDSWAVGLWTFSTNLNGTQDYLPLVPIGPLATQRSQLIAQLGTIQPIPTGDTGLYDTLLAAYQEVQKAWDPGRVNSIVMMTDGDNDDDNGISHADLLAKLGELADPQRPIQVIIIGIGENVNPAPLEEVTKTTGGGVFVARDPAKIGEIFLQAISLRSATAPAG